jgi:cell division protein FtsZ
MTFNPEQAMPPGAKIKVIGVGGGGGNAVNTMIRSTLDGVDFVACNTDIQALQFSLAPYKIQVGRELTRGLGAGADPDVGRDAALEDRHEIQEMLNGADMVFITAGMGGGTGTGGASVVAQIARELGALTVAVVTKPFAFEGKRRRKHAEAGIARLRECVDTLITIPNQRLLQVASPTLSMVDAFKMADEVLVNAVRGISDIINIPGTVNVDFADVKTVMSCMGQALMGIGRARGEKRAVEAARMAIKSPLLEDIDIEGATGILINITAGADVSLMEVNEACSIIQEAAHEDANIIFGAVIDETLGDEICVTVIATGFPVDKDEEDGDVLRTAPQTSTQPLTTPYTRLTTTMPAAKPAQRPLSPQHYSPLTTKKPEPIVARPAAPVAQPVVPTPAPAAPVMQPSAFARATQPAPQPVVAAPAPVPAAPIFASQPEPMIEPLAATAPEPSIFDAPASAPEATPPVVAAPVAPSPEAAPQAFNEAQELARWTLAAEDDDIPSLANPFAAPEAPAPVAAAPVVPAAQPQRVGAQAIHDPNDDLMSDLSPASEPDTSIAESLFDAGQESSDDTFALGAEASNEGEPAPLESFFQDDSVLIADDIDRKIDEALELAQKLKNPVHPAEGDDLDVPAFLRQNMKDLPLG